MNMKWARMLLLLLIPLITTKSFAEETEVSEAKTIESNNIINEVGSSEDNSVQLDSKLRNALLKALSELQGEGAPAQDLEDEEENIKRAQASAVSYQITGDEENVVATQDQQDETKTLENKITTTVQESTNNFPSNSDSEENLFEHLEDSSTEKASEELLKGSNGIQSVTITTLDKEPADLFKDAEQIITSSSNSFVSENSDSVNSQTPRSVRNDESDTNLLIPASETDFEPETPIDEPPFVKTYIRPLGNIVTDDEVPYVKSADTFVKSSNVQVNSKSSVTSEVKNTEIVNSGVRFNENIGNTEATTEATVEVSTEESEAKVEQVQFFSAPLVAAFTVHQDEKGLPKKVEPIFKNEIVPKKGQLITQQNVLQNANLQSTTFNNVDLQRKQQILEQELEKLRSQQLLRGQSLLPRHNVGINPISNNLDVTESGFSQAIKQNFNQFDPIFTEPDRSIVTKLATIDPNTLLSHNGGPVLNKFTPSEAILPIANPVKPSFGNQPVLDLRTSPQNLNNNDEVSLVPSISLDSIIQGGKLPVNAQILPTKEPTGFFNFVPQPNTQNQPAGLRLQNSALSFSNSNPSIQQSSLNLVQPSSNFGKPSSNFVRSNINSDSLAQSQQNPIAASQNLAQPSQTFLQSTSNLIQPSTSNFVGSSVQNNIQSVQNSNFLRNQVSLNQVPSQGVTNFQNLNQNNDFLTSNRILRQEQGIANPGLNQNSFTIIKSQQPFNPIQEIGYFPDNNRFLRPNQGSSSTNLVGKNYLSPNLGLTQNSLFNGNSQTQNKFFGSNLVGSITNPDSFTVQQSVQPFKQQTLSNNLQNNRFFNPNQESTLSAPQSFRSTQYNVGFSQSPLDYNRFLRSNQESTFLSNQNRFSAPVAIQTYKYSNSFGFPTIPLNKK